MAYFQLCRAAHQRTRIAGRACRGRGDLRRRRDQAARPARLARRHANQLADRHTHDGDRRPRRGFLCDTVIQTTLAADLIQNGFRDHLGTLLPPFFLNDQKWSLSFSVSIQLLSVSVLGCDAWFCTIRLQPVGLCQASRGLQPGGARGAPTSRRRAEALGFYDEGRLRGLSATRASHPLRCAVLTVLLSRCILFTDKAILYNGAEYDRGRASQCGNAT